MNDTESDIDSRLLNVWPDLEKDSLPALAVKITERDAPLLAEASDLEASLALEVLSQFLSEISAQYDGAQNAIHPDYFASTNKKAAIQSQHIGFLAGAIQRASETSSNESLSFQEAFQLANDYYRSNGNLDVGLQEKIAASKDDWALNKESLPKDALGLFLNSQGEIGGRHLDSVLPKILGEEESIADFQNWLLTCSNAEVEGCLYKQDAGRRSEALMAIYVFMHDGWMVSKAVQEKIQSKKSRFTDNEYARPSREFFESSKNESIDVIIKDIDQYRAYLAWKKISAQSQG